MTHKMGDKKSAGLIENETLEELIANIKKAPRFDTGNTSNKVALKRMASYAGITMKDETVEFFVDIIRDRMQGVRDGQKDRLNIIQNRYGKKTYAQDTI